MKKVLFSFALFFSILSAKELNNFLSNSYNELFDTQLQKSLKESDYNSISWISPIMLTYKRSWSTQIPDGTHPVNSYSVSINQPIFKSGGIYYGIKFAKANYSLAKASIIKKKRELIAKAIELLFKIKQTKLTIAKLKMQVKNRDIEIKNANELYSAGLNGSVELDRAMANKDEAQIAMLDMRANLEELKGAFRKLSSKNPDRLKLPKLSLIGKERFINNNTELAVAKSKAISKDYQAKMTRSKYLPTVSIGASYTKVSKAQPFTRDKFANYSLSISMPISVNMGNDLEMAKLDSMIAKIELKNSKNSAVQDYNIVNKKIAIINRRIALAQKEARVYARLLKSTKNLYKAGQKSKMDVDLIRNSFKIKRLDAQIYRLSKQIELLKLYAKVY